jgi:glycolate oxidase FAD binding subunit
LPEILYPSTAEELRDALASAGSSKRTIELFGGNTKRLMAGPIQPADVRLSTSAMRRILQYEPRDLTISAEAGLPFAQLNAELARHGQMIPLDGPYHSEATAGGMIAANISGARRRLYGTARDLVIGMKFATLDGKLVQSGGMVVKNVAGLDMAKLMIGSFGTLAAIASVNFKLTPRPAVARTVLFACEDLKTAIEARDAAIRGQWNPIAVELLNPVLAAQLSLKGYTLALSFAGNQAVIERCLREAAALGPMRTLSVEEEQRFWSSLDGVTPHFLEKFREGVVVRVSTTLAECGDALAGVDAPGLAHAGTGVVRGWFTRPDAAARWLAATGKKGWKGVIEYSSEAARASVKLWPEPGGDFVIMKQIKRMFDPEGLLNRGRLFGQI